MSYEAIQDTLITLIKILSPGEFIALAFIPSVINKRKPAVSTIAWVLALVALPYIGVLAYLFLGENRMQRRVRHRQKTIDQLSPNLQDVGGAVEDRRMDDESQIQQLPPLTEAMARLALGQGAFAHTNHNHVDVLDGGEQKFPTLMADLRRARHHIHLEYYIFESDETGQQIRDLLIEKAKEGVEVRVLWDALGSYSVYAGFFDGLEAVGGQAVSFMPATLTRRRFEINFRNHRKIAVIDGRIGFTGGMNIGNSYSGLNTTAWRDVHLRIEGPAVHDLQETFTEDWFFACREDLASQDYFPQHRRPGDEIVQIVPSGPDTDWSTIHDVFFAALTLARERAFIMTPYFVPTESLLDALKTAALRGVDVRLLLPSESDQPLAFYAGRSYYEELLEAGVRIIEHTASILHGKIMSVDGHFATVGTANMDERSFHLNFEINALLYSTSLAHRIEALIHRDMDAGNEIHLPEFLRRPYRIRLAENACRLLSPML